MALRRLDSPGFRRLDSPEPDRRLDEISDLLGEGKIRPAEAVHRLAEVERPSQVIAVRGTEQEDEERARARRALEILKELNSLVGLSRVKRLVQEIRAFTEIQQRRKREGLVAEPVVLHMVFKGNPGTGKTTVARIIGRLFKEMGVLSKGHLIEVERADLVGEYIGHTAQKTREQLKRAQGGVLFIDEAYSLARGGEKDFGKESIDVLVKAMEDQRDAILIIIAGYLREMEWFMTQNPGLRSRFPIQLEFADYTARELLQIADLMLAQRQYRLSLEARAYLELKLSSDSLGLFSDDIPGNARRVRNLLELGIRRQALRLTGRPTLTRDDLMLLERCDLEDGECGR
ncbi:MAG: AAA family ATPase [Symbiobacteriia bacterium]